MEIKILFLKFAEVVKVILQVKLIVLSNIQIENRLDSCIKISLTSK